MKRIDGFIYFFAVKIVFIDMTQILRNFLKNRFVLYVIINHIKERKLVKVDDPFRGGECMESSKWVSLINL